MPCSSLIRRLAFGLLGTVALLDGPAHAEWKAGLGEAVITPPKPMWMSGYASRDKPAEGTLTELKAKVLLLEDEGGRRAALVTFDLVGIDRELSQDIKRDIAEAMKIDPSGISLCCSHTHTGPVVHNNLRAMYILALGDDQWALIAEYSRFLRQRVLYAVAQALRDLSPSQLSLGLGTAGFAVNRRNNKEADVPSLRANGMLQGPVDHDVPVLAVRRDGELRGIVFGYACHATVLSSFEWSGDYPGFAQLELEQRHPGAIAMFWAGCGADQNPLPRREVELAKDYGRQLADGVDTVLAKQMHPIAGSITTTYREIKLPFADVPSREELDKLARDDAGYEGRRARVLLEQDQSGGIPADYPYPVQTWRLGDAPAWVFLGGEVVVDYSLRIKSIAGGEAVWTAGYANDVLAYIPSLRVLKEGGYEGGGAMVYYGLPSAWDETVEERIVAEVRRQLDENAPTKAP
jgi:neutral ceramidase